MTLFRFTNLSQTLLVHRCVSPITHTGARQPEPHRDDADTTEPDVRQSLLDSVWESPYFGRYTTLRRSQCPKPIRLFKLVTGELVLGKFDEEANMLEDVAIIQVVPTQQGVQMMMLPYGYPFEQEFKGSISGEHFMYEYKKLPDDLETKYLEACTNLTLSTGGLVGAAGKSPLIK